jgi:hypothetical protein
LAHGAFTIERYSGCVSINFQETQMKRALTFAAFLAAAPAMAQTTTPAPSATTLPANVQADLALVKEDMTELKSAMTQLRADERSASANVATDRTAVRLARLKLRMDAQRLHQDALPILQADQAALFNALTQLHNDQAGNNAGALAADEAAVAQAEQQLRVDATAIGGGIHRGRWDHRP